MVELEGELRADFRFRNALQNFRDSRLPSHMAPIGLTCQQRIAVIRALPTGDANWPGQLTDFQGAQLVGFPCSSKVEEFVRPLDLPGPFDREFCKALFGAVVRISMRLDRKRQSG